MELTFPNVYPCSIERYCTHNCCASRPFFETTVDEPALMNVFSKEPTLLAEPTKLAMGKYTWDDDFSARGNKPAFSVPLQNLKEVNAGKIMLEQKSKIQPPALILDQDVEQKKSGLPRYKREEYVRTLVSPRGIQKEKIVEENGQRRYYLNNKPVTEAYFNELSR